MLEDQLVRQTPDNVGGRTDNQFEQGNQFTSQKQSRLIVQWNKQISSERVRFIIINLLNLIFFTFVAILTTLWILHDQKLIKFNISDWFVLFTPWIIIPCTLLGGILLIKNSLDWYRFNKEKNLRFASENDFELEHTPNFIINIYKRTTAWLIFFRWLLGVSVVFGGLFLGFIIYLQNNKNITFPFLLSEITITSSEDYSKEIIIVSSYLGAIFVLYLWVWISSSRKISELLAVFNIHKTYPEQNLHSYKRKVHIFCFCILLLPFFIIFILRWIIRRFRGGGKK